MEVISKIEKPFDIDANTFSKNTLSDATLFVPEGKINKYKDALGWKKFVHIEESSQTSITDIDNGRERELKRYTLDGRVIKNIHKGINIIQMNNGATKKIVVR